MNTPRKIISEHLTVNHENHDHYLIIAELINDTIVATYTAKIPEPFLRYPYGYPIYPN